MVFFVLSLSCHYHLTTLSKDQVLLSAQTQEELLYHEGGE